MQGKQFEQLLVHELPAVLAELLEISQDEVHVETALHPGSEYGPDAIVHAAGRTWVLEAKSSSGVANVARASEQLRSLRHQYPGAISVLVVPHMTAGAVRAAAERDLNWIDLSGNARLRDQTMLIKVVGRPNRFPRRGRPSSPFAPKSSRVARVLLENPFRWRRQRDLVEVTQLDDGHLSRIVGRLEADDLLDVRDGEFRPRDPDLLLDAWADDYRFDRHDVVLGHATGSGIDLVRHLTSDLSEAKVHHAFTGLPAAWLMSHHAQFRLCSVYVDGLPREVAERIDLRLNERGANVQLIGPDDLGVFHGQRELDQIPCVSPVQVYLDLQHLPERAGDAADQLRDDGLLWGSHV